MYLEHPENGKVFVDLCLLYIVPTQQRKVFAINLHSKSIRTTGPGCAITEM